MMITQGGEANISGSGLEAMIERAFSARGVVVDNHIDDKDNMHLFDGRRLIRRVPYKSIYGCHSVSEFVYRHDGIIDVRIECRWQQSSGSVDEKFPYLFLNARDAMPERCVWIVIEGGGARKQSIDWIKNEVAKVTSKTIRVLTIAEINKSAKQLVDHGIG